ncbi:Similar to 1-phosphatidylinositol phosphodiesterase (Bacillus thuringiensis) [Cotesia congregata]|uniref:Similar to 1-phosphatidylinositol phosphodiesterase (Bacillus thuringiensis) n=1 Tax=Cotesia congregata TaxID=51543 RepID=A0A8J2HA38_COTCN|nr:Similar to 1-phosphatidylinositol phosphodiesterase (Bacillus thuringiensis) [Cotesia congregata]
MSNVKITKVHRKNILSLLPDNHLLGQLSLIGTHQSMTFSSSDIKLRKQELNITEQLNHGVRVFDISVRIETNYFKIYYQNQYLEASFNSLVYEINKFLKKNSQEFVILIINVDHEKKINSENILSPSYCEILNNYLGKYIGGERMHSKWSFDDKLHSLRGKILLATYQVTFAECAVWLGARCLMTDKLKFVENSFLYSHGNYQEDNIDYKWKKYMKFVASDLFDYYPCFIYDLSIYDEIHYSQGAAKYGGFDVNGQCFVPMNYRIDNYCRGDHKSAFNIFIVDYPTQEVIDHINGYNSDYHNPFEIALM